MSIEKIIAEAIENNPLKMKEAFEEEMNSRIRIALEEKYKKMMAKEEDEDEDEDEDDDDDDLDEGSIKGSGTDRKAQLKKAFRAGEKDTRQFNTPGGYPSNKPKSRADRGIKNAYAAGRKSDSGGSTPVGDRRSQAQDELQRAKAKRSLELARRARERGDMDAAKKHAQAAYAKK